MTHCFEAPLWRMPVYARLVEEVDPHTQLDRFRQRNLGYTGNLSFWKTPSPEPRLPLALVERLSEPLDREAPIRTAASQMAGKLRAQFDPEQMLLVAILRAGVPVADWLRRMLPGSVAVATSLFVGLGIDQAALRAICADYPTRQVIFVDGWTGKGGVAKQLRQLDAGPLAVLSDPWGQAEYAGTRDDVFSPSACFTGPTTLGFSRTFFQSAEEVFSAYRFPGELLEPRFINAWQAATPEPAEPSMTQFSHTEPIEHDTPLRLHSNEVCRALINSNPETLLFAGSPHEARRKFAFLLALADSQNIPQQFDVASLRPISAEVACTLRLSG